MPRLQKGTTALTPKNNREQQRWAARRQELRDRRELDLELAPPRRKNGPLLGVAGEIDCTLFLEQNVDPRLQVHNCGTFTTQCHFCRALRWPGENPSFCCQKGQVRIPLPQPPPQELLKYYDVSRAGNDFLANCRSYNNAMALASFGCNQQFIHGFNPTFTVQGQLCHRIGNLLPANGESAKFAQIFFHETESEANNRMQHFNDLQENIVTDFQNQLHAVNNYVQSFKSAIEICRENNDVQIVLHADRRQQNGHSRTYNLPQTSEVAAILPGNSPGGNLDIIIRCRSTDGHELRRISTCHRSYDPLHYTVMFPYGCDGWHLNLKKQNNKTLSPADFYCFRLQVRENDFNIVMKMRKLTQQYAVDQWAKIESNRLNWVRLNQRAIRAEKYQGLLDAANAGDTVNAGRKIILPPTIYGSPRFYAEAFQNAMAIVRHLGKPDIFITFTCNPKWPEITSALNNGEQPCDRPDLTCRVFKQKFDSLMDDITKKQILGGVKAHTATIEFQKRGLPHAHILLIMDNASKPNCPEKIDKLVSSEIPDVAINPTLTQVITTHNIHGPCGAVNPNSPCMEEDGPVKRCSKKFPKPFSDTTSVSERSYPNYRRRSPLSGGNTHTKRMQNGDFTVDNSFVVPYNPTLSLRYRAHINVEIVHSVEAVKYLYKYVTKGQDRVLMALRDGNDGDEVMLYQNARYISASEAFWRLYGFEIHRKYPPVEKLPCHLPNEQTVLFEQGDAENVINQGPPHTKLTAFFNTNIEDEMARNIPYPNFPQFFTWNSKDKKWCRRKRGVRNTENPQEVKSECIGRIPTISLSPHQSELYYLRLLLHHKPGATSFENLRTIQNVECATFQEACRAMNLLDDDRERDRVMEEAASIRFGPQLRAVFATILIYCRPSDPFEFWMRHKLELCRDLMHNTQQPMNVIENQVLIQLQDILDSENLDLERDFLLPKPIQDNSVNGVPRIVQEELNYDHDNLRAKVEQEYNHLNNEQKIVFDAVVDSVENESGMIFALNASGGTGKTHTINLILDAVRSKKKIALATALSGIAATLLSGGRTLHSRCKIPLDIHEHSTCNVSQRDHTGKLIQMCSLIVIDEVSMGHKYLFEALDRTLQDIRHCDKPFGGLTILLAGDWRQILPVVRHGGRSEIVNATLKSSFLWPNVTQLYLYTNMRVALSNDSAEFANFLISVGDGKEHVYRELGPFTVKLPEDIKVDSREELLNFVFPNLQENFNDAAWLSSRAIICPTNSAADDINDRITHLFPGDPKTYLSSDSVLESEHQYPLEFINKLCPSGMPPHKLSIKQHSVIMLLRNLDPTKGHCNGTRYIVERLHDHIIEATIACGAFAGKRLFIPRIPMIPSDNIFPFQMKRKQFPIRPAFALTSNKAQGQTLKTVGIYIPQPFFSHGQLYVAMSRVGSRENLRILTNASGSYTSNVVYQEVLRG